MFEDKLHLLFGNSGTINMVNKHCKQIWQSTFICGTHSVKSLGH